MRQEVVRQQHRLRPLQVRVGRQPSFAGLGGACGKYLLQDKHTVRGENQLALDEQAQVAGHLVVAAAGSVQPGAGGPGQLGDAALHGRVDVLVAGGEGEVARSQLGGGDVQRLGHGCTVGLAQQAGTHQAAHVRLRAGDVVGGQPLVVGDAGGVLHEHSGRRHLQASRPERAPRLRGWRCTTAGVVSSACACPRLALEDALPGIDINFRVRVLRYALRWHRLRPHQCHLWIPGPRPCAAAGREA